MPSKILSRDYQPHPQKTLPSNFTREILKNRQKGSVETMITSRPTALITLLTLLGISILSGCAGREIGGSNNSLAKSGCQKIVDGVVKESMNRLHPKRVIVIVADPSNGEILAVSSQTHGSNKQTDDWVTWINEPGSTFKPVVVVAALQEGKITPETEINCENGAFPFGGKVIRDHGKYGEMTFDEILMKSSNIGAAKMSMLLKDSVYNDYVHRFRFGTRTGINVKGESAGIVYPVDRWDALTKARMSFGQSVAITPIQLTMAYCALANGGKLMKPVIGDEKPTVVRRVCSKKTADAVKNALAKVASNQGTAPLARVNGITVGGKTGTSQVIAPDGNYAEDQYVTSFAGFFPVEHPRAVCVVVVDQADLPAEQNYGGVVAAPIFAQIAKKTAPLLGIKLEKYNSAALNQ